MIYRHESCWILSLPSIGQYKIEFIYCPRFYRIKEHSHDNQDIELFFLFGHNIKFYRRSPEQTNVKMFFARFSHIGRHFTIKAGDQHYFEVSNFPLIFMNIEKWKEGIKPTSAAKDFNLCQDEKQVVVEVVD